MKVLAAIILILGAIGFKQSGVLLPLAEESFEEGVNARGTAEESKFFRIAADHYEELRRCSAHNAALYRNQGNASLLAGDLPGAILAYRRGLRLSPNDRQMRISLGYAREQVVYSSSDNFARPPVDLWPPWLPRLSARSSFWIFAVFYALAWVGLARMLTQSTDGRGSLMWLGLAGSVLFAVILMVQLHNLRADLEHPLVVIAEDKIYLLKGNNALYPRASETPLNRGVEARLIQLRGSWLQIELTGGQIGWAPRENALLDLP